MRVKWFNSGPCCLLVDFIQGPNVAWRRIIGIRFIRGHKEWFLGAIKSEGAIMTTDTQREAENTDKEIWRTTPDDYYSKHSLYITEQGALTICEDGKCVTRPLEDWHQSAWQAALSQQPVGGREIAEMKDILEQLERVEDKQIGVYHTSSGTYRTWNDGEYWISNSTTRLRQLLARFNISDRGYQAARAESAKEIMNRDKALWEHRCEIERLQRVVDAANRVFMCADSKKLPQSIQLALQEALAATQNTALKSHDDT